MANTLTLIAPMCSCCETASELLPRLDLPGSYAACPRTGQLYQAEGERYVPATIAGLAEPPSAPSVHIDLSRAGYA